MTGTRTVVDTFGDVVVVHGTERGPNLLEHAARLPVAVTPEGCSTPSRRI